jgi:hypothetical protein
VGTANFTQNAMPRVAPMPQDVRLYTITISLFSAWEVPLSLCGEITSEYRVPDTMPRADLEVPQYFDRYLLHCLGLTYFVLEKMQTPVYMYWRAVAIIVATFAPNEIMVRMLHGFLV